MPHHNKEAYNEVSVEFPGPDLQCMKLLLLCGVVRTEVVFPWCD